MVRLQSHYDKTDGDDHDNVTIHQSHFNNGEVIIVMTLSCHSCRQQNSSRESHGNFKSHNMYLNVEPINNLIDCVCQDLVNGQEIRLKLINGYLFPPRLPYLLGHLAQGTMYR